MTTNDLGSQPAELAEEKVMFTGDSAIKAGDFLTVDGTEYLVVASLPEVEVSVSKQYDFDLILDDTAPVGAELFYFANADETGKSEDDEIVDVTDDTGEEINTVPESRLITISPWLNAGVTYQPVIAVKLEK